MAFFFRPKLLDSLKGYTREQLGTDIAAGITVGVVALPLAMAFAIASGLKPEAGLFTAIIAASSSRYWAAAKFKLAVQLAPSLSLCMASWSAMAWPI
jgi:MFS superfamily sulfate permease-like transporter